MLLLGLPVIYPSSYIAISQVNFEKKMRNFFQIKFTITMFNISLILWSFFHIYKFFYYNKTACKWKEITKKDK